MIRCKWSETLENIHPLLDVVILPNVMNVNERESAFFNAIIAQFLIELV